MHSSRSGRRHRRPVNHEDDYYSNIPSAREQYDHHQPGSSSHHARQVNWRGDDADMGQDRYGFIPAHDSYNSGGRDYDPGLREHDGWSGHHDMRYSSNSSRDHWSAQDMEYSPYVPSTSNGYDKRPVSYDPWSSADDPRSSHQMPNDSYYDPNMPSRWGSNDHRDVNRTGRGDTGWEPRRSDSGWDRSRQGSNGQHSQAHPPQEDRTWEPAPSWTPSNYGQQGYSQNHRDQHGQSRGQNGRNKGGKKGNNQNKGRQKRDWRNDDSHLNNWQRRDFTTESQSPPKKTSSSKAASKRKYLKSKSPSHSPAGSHYSRRSSPARSVSPEMKRRRHDLSPSSGRSPSSGDRGRRPRRSSPERQSPTLSHRSLGSGLSRNRSRSSTSRSRSRSASPVGRRAVHRLPTATKPEDIQFVPAPVARQDSQQQTNGKKSKRRNNGKGRNQAARTDAMPPPAGPVISTATLEPRPDVILNHPLPHPPYSVEPTLIPNSRFKSNAFKPVGGSQSSELRKFFPDEEDMDMSPPSRATPLSAPPPITPAASEAPSNFFVPANHYEAPSLADKVQLPPTASTTITPQLPPQREPTLKNEITPCPDPAPQTELPPKPTVALPAPSPALEPVETPITVDKQPSSTPKGDSSSPRARDSERPSKDVYVIVSQVGEGTFGQVYKAQNTISKIPVALKRIRMESEKEGFPVTAMREIKLLQSLRHDNVIQLFEMMVSNGSVYMVFEYMDHDLTGILAQTQFSFSDANLKSLSHQMLAGLAHLHHKGIVHRDIKGSNILLNNRGELKLADFGLARFYQKRRKMDYTNRVITLWYRPPELLFGATVYGPEVDMWSAACIMLELFTKKPVFQGNDEIHQLDVIYRIIGTPTPDRWPGMFNLPWYELIKPREQTPNHFRNMFSKWMSTAALDLAEKLLCYDPTQRYSATQAMEVPYFTEELPMAEKPIGLAQIEGEWHELESKIERAKKRKRKDGQNTSSSGQHRT